MLATVLLSALLAVAAASPTPSPRAPTTVEQGSHTGSLVAGEDAVFAIELDGGLARTQLGLELPPDASEVELTLAFSVPDAPAQACTQNAVVLSAGSIERPGLDSRRTDDPDPGDPCTQPGTHLLTATLTDPRGTLDDRTVPFVLLVSVIGEDPEMDASSASVPPSPVPATSAPSVAPAPPVAVAAARERRPVGRAVVTTVVVLGAVGGAAALARRRRGGRDRG